jgi:hypothetical protein
MTKGYGGRQIIKRISVHTNDAQHPNLQLVVKGKVKKFVTIRPKRVRLTGAVGDVVRQTVAVIPEKSYPFRIIETIAKPGKNIKFTFEEKKGEASPEYQIVIENIRQQAGQYSDTVIIKTDSKEKPEIKIRVFGNITKPKGSSSSSSAPSSTLKKTAGGVPTVKLGTSSNGSSGGVKINISKKTKAE